MDLVTLLIVQAIAFLILLVWVKRRVDRELSADRALEQVRKEIGELITELNGTTERNITLIEDRVQRLNSILESADRKIGVLKKESEKHEIGTAMYSDLLEQRRRQVRASGEALPVQRNAPPFVDAAQSGVMSSQAYTENPVTDDTGHGAMSESDSAEMFGSSPVRGTTSPRDSGGAQQQPSSRGKGLRNQVRDLHRAGLAAETIAKRLGSTVGEVELIIGLEAGSNEDLSD